MADFMPSQDTRANEKESGPAFRPKNPGEKREASFGSAGFFPARLAHSGGQRVLGFFALSLLLALVFLFLLSSGCLGKIDPWDQFNSSVTVYAGKYLNMQILFSASTPQGVLDGFDARGIVLADRALAKAKLDNFVSPANKDERIEILDKYNLPGTATPIAYVVERRGGQLAVLAPSSCAPLPGPTPCSCMVCRNEKSLWESDPVFGKLIKWLNSQFYVESTLAGSTCTFADCNQYMFNEYLAAATPGGKTGYCAFRQPDGTSKEYRCTPRFFMIGGGPNAGEFSMAQTYCAGKLTMPVLWATSKDTNSKPTLPSYQLMACYLSRGQMPVVVWYSQGKFTKPSDFEAMASKYGQSSSSSGAALVDGPAILTTEAMLDPRAMPQPSGVRPPAVLYDRAKLDEAMGEIKTIKTKCPKCLAALALKPMFKPVNPDDPTSLNLTPDLCPLDYLLTESTGAPVMDCPAKFGMSEEGYVAHRRQVAAGQNYLMTDLVGIGFIANEDDNIPSCSAQAEAGKYMSYSRAVLNKFSKPSVWYAAGFSDGATLTPGCTLTQYDVANAYNYMMGSISGFVASGVIGYAPYRFLDSPNALPMACDVKTKVFDTAVPSGELSLVGSAAIQSSDGTKTLTPTHRISFTPAAGPSPAYATFSAIDFGGAEHTYLAVPEGGYVSIYLSGCRFGFRSEDGTMHNLSLNTWFDSCQYYFTNLAPLASDITHAPGTDTPTRGSATQQPVVFSRNGMGGVCSVAPANKMIQQTFSLSNAPVLTEAMKPSTDPKTRAQTSALQCNDCLSPMPKAFCRVRTDLSGFYAFPPQACTQYSDAGIDDAFMLSSLDPIFMRSISVSESSLGTGSDKSSTDSPACKISSSSSATGCFANAPASYSLKTQAKLSSSASSYCDAGTLAANAAGIDNSQTFACGLGLSGAPEGPGEATSYSMGCGGGSYNPFEPYSNACAGANRMGALYAQALADLRDAALANADVAKLTAQDDNVKWYALWAAAYRYKGMPLDKAALAGYSPASSSDSLIKYVHLRMLAYCGSKTDCDPYYGTRAILRYNEGLKSCKASCLARYCERLPAPPSGSSTGGVPADEGEDEGGDSADWVAPGG